MGGRPQPPGGPLGGDARGHQVAVFAVTAHYPAPLPHGPDHIQGRGVGHPQVVVGEIYFIGGHPRPFHICQLGLNGRSPILDGHVKSVVAGGGAAGPAVPGVQRGGQAGPPLRLGEVQHGGGPPGQGGQCAGGPAVRRLIGQALVHLKVGVGVDKAGKDQPAGRVDHPAVPGGQAGADLGDLLPLHPQVGHDGPLRAEKRAVLYEDGHSDPS